MQFSGTISRYGVEHKNSANFKLLRIPASSYCDTLFAHVNNPFYSKEFLKRSHLVLMAANYTVLHGCIFLFEQERIFLVDNYRLPVKQSTREGKPITNLRSYAHLPCFKYMSSHHVHVRTNQIDLEDKVHTRNFSLWRRNFSCCFAVSRSATGKLLWEVKCYPIRVLLWHVKWEGCWHKN